MRRCFISQKQMDTQGPIVKKVKTYKKMSLGVETIRMKLELDAELPKMQMAV